MDITQSKIARAQADARAHQAAGRVALAQAARDEIARQRVALRLARRGLAR